MKKGIIIATALVGIAGGVALGQSSLFGSAQNEEFLTASAAKKIALQQFSGTVIDYDFDRDDMTPHYDFEIKNDTEEVDVEVDAVSGAAKITERKSLMAQSPIEKAEDTVEDKIDQVEAQAEIVRDTARQEVANKVQVATEKQATGSQAVTAPVANETKPAVEQATPKTNQVAAQPVQQAPAQQTQQVQQAAQNIISKSQAIAIAQAKASGTVTQAKLDHDDGIQVYEIEIKNGNTEYDFEIHAATGQILQFDADHDDDND